MKKLLMIAGLAAFSFGCGGAATTTPTTSSNNSLSGGNGPNAAPTGTVNPAAVASRGDSPFVVLKASAGKTATEAKIWDNKAINDRLEKLLGPDYAAMKKNWNTESPIKVDGDVLMMNGCEQHNCGVNQYVIFADAAKDNINVMHIASSKLKEYKEKGDITIPKAFEADWNNMKAGAK